MAVRERSSAHPREKIMKTDNKNEKKVYLVAQELKLARVLAGNNKTSRDRALKSLKKWFSHRSKTLPFTDNDFQIIWKGLYFSMWMSDKPLVQEECAENIASLIYFETVAESLLFFKAGLTILINEWFGIDQLRLDKFLMLVRRLLRHMLMALKEHGLSKKNIDKFGEIISYTILNTEIHPPVGLFMHFTEIFLEEVAKVTKGNITSERLVDFIRPFIKKLAVTSDGREISHIKKFIFTYLIKQSNLGLEYRTKYEAWKNEGFPGTIDSMQKVTLDDDEKMSSEGEDSESKAVGKPLDPRAGRVDVELPQIKFKARDVANALTEFKFDKDSNAKSRKTIGELINHFSKLSKGMYPLEVKKVLDSKADSYDTNIRKAANRLIKFENKLLGKEKKKKKRSRENGEEKAEVPQKRRKVDANEDVDGKLPLNGNEAIQTEFKKFNTQNEGSLGKKTKKNKKNIKKPQQNDENVNEKLSLNGDDVTEEELEKFIVQSELNLGKKIKKKNKNVAKQQLSADESAGKEKISLNGDNSGKKVMRHKKVDEHHHSNKIDNTIEIKRNEINDEKLKRKRKNETNDTKETKRKKKARAQPREEIIDNIECVFERNSGTWVVYDVSRDKENVEVAPTQKAEVHYVSLGSPIKDKESPSTSSTNAENAESVLPSGKSPSTSSADLGSPSDGNQIPSKNKGSPPQSPNSEQGSPKSGVSPVRLFESPQETKDLFPKSSWDEPLQEGEYEICIPSKKHVAKLKRHAKRKNQSVHELINTSMKRIRGKGRLSLDLSLVTNPFSTPGNAKKVKINTKLNKSQEIHEHVQQILSSPGIPYDANKKPLKPLLKACASSTPVNPFYNKQLNVW